MKYLLKKTILLLALGTGLACLSVCTEPSPLYGTWSDNRGNTFSFFEDGTFNAKVRVNAGSNNYDGNYSVQLNALTLNCTNVELRVVTEWDIRGNMLFFYWTDEDGELRNMTLYKIG
jgi:hypothetical protein